MKRKLFYLASPYSHDNQHVKDYRFQVVQDVTVKLLLDANIYAFSPIAYNHPMVIHDLPTDWSFWENYDKAFIDHCDGLVVLTIDGWQESIGVQAEIEYAKELNLPVVYLSMEQVSNKDYGHILNLIKGLKSNG
jgi:hypothetical protein